MQIHELTKKQLNEVDLAGPNGLWAGIKSAGRALVQPGGAKDAFRTVTPGANQGLGSTAALTQSDFAQRMQAVKNNAATKQVAANLQKQWNQYKTTVSPMTQITPAQQAQQQGLKSQLLAKKVSGAPKTAKLPLPESQALTEATGVMQLTNWYKQSVIPKSMAAAASKYLANPNIQTALKNIVATENQPDKQSTAFADLVAATSVVSQQIAAENPQVATATGGAPKSTKTVASSTDVAKTNISKTAGITSSQIAAIEKIMGGLPPVTSSDPNTIAYLRALGFEVR